MLLRAKKRFSEHADFSTGKDLSRAFIKEFAEESPGKFTIVFRGAQSGPERCSRDDSKGVCAASEVTHILLRFMAIEDEKKLKLSRRVASVWVVIAMGIAVLIGVVGRTLSNANIVPQLSGNDTETIIVRIADVISQNGVFFAIIAGLILAGILASTMSTADSQLLAAASSVSENILQETFHLKISAKKGMLIARITVVLIAVLEKRCGIPFYTSDVYMNAMGGIKLGEPSVDLAVCAALASAASDVPIDKYTAVFGEVGLTGEVRSVTYAEKRVNECIKTGFKTVVLPAKNMKTCEKFKDKIQLVPVNYVNQMVKALNLRSPFNPQA